MLQRIPGESGIFSQEEKSWQKPPKLNIYPEMEVEELYQWFINLSLPTYPKAMYFYFSRNCNKLVFLSSTVFTYILNKVLNKESITSFVWQKNKKDRHYILFSKKCHSSAEVFNCHAKAPIIFAPLSAFT